MTLSPLSEAFGVRPCEKCLSEGYRRRDRFLLWLATRVACGCALSEWERAVARAAFNRRARRRSR
jgi:hypothetical protein